MHALTIAGLAFVAVAGLVHVAIFLLESVVWRSRGARIFGLGPTEAEIVRVWALNQGWYNLLLAVGALVGAVVGAVTTLAADAPGELRAASIAVGAFAAIVMLAASVVLACSTGGRLRAALIQGLAPLIGLLLLAIGAVA